MDVRKEKREQVMFLGKVCSKEAVFATVPASRAHGWVSMSDRFVTEENHDLLELVQCSFAESEFCYNTSYNNQSIQIT